VALPTSEGAGDDRLTGLAPIFDARVRLLILGSFPSPASLAAQQYYGHRQNHFWRLVGEILGEPLFELPYPERTARVLERGIGIWDVYQACIRPGALDADIRAGGGHNDLWPGWGPGARLAAGLFQRADGGAVCAAAGKTGTGNLRAALFQPGLYLAVCGQAGALAGGAGACCFHVRVIVLPPFFPVWHELPSYP